MPQYTLPPWLHPQDTVGPYAAGLRQSQQLAQQLQLQREHLGQQAAMAQMEAQIKQEQSEKQNMLEQQRIEVGAAYQQQQVSLKQQEIAQDQQKLQMATQQAARKYQIGQSAAARIAAGEAPSKVWGELGPEMTGSLTGLGAVLKAGEGNKEPNIPQVMELPGTGGRQVAYNQRSGAFQLLDRDQQVMNRQMALERVRAKRAMLKQAQTEHDSDFIKNFAMKPESEIKQLSPATQAQIQAWRDRGNQLKTQAADLDKMLAGPQQQGQTPDHGVKRGKFNSATGAVDWNVGTLPPDMTEIGVPQGQEQDQEPQ